MLSYQLTLQKLLPIILTVSCCFTVIHKTLAQCSSQIGELKVVNFQHEDGIFICYNDIFDVELEDYELMDSQQLYYVYHNVEDVLNSEILKVDTMKTDGFLNDEFAPDTLYLTAVASSAASLNWLQDSLRFLVIRLKFFVYLQYLLIIIHVISP